MRCFQHDHCPFKFLVLCLQWRTFFQAYLTAGIFISTLAVNACREWRLRSSFAFTSLGTEDWASVLWSYNWCQFVFTSGSIVETSVSSSEAGECTLGFLAGVNISESMFESLLLLSLFPSNCYPTAGGKDFVLLISIYSLKSCKLG